MDKSLIMRQAAMDAVRDYPDDLISQLTAIEDLPSVEPEIIRCKDCKHWNDLRNAVSTVCVDYADVVIALTDEEKLPSAQPDAGFVTVVRCKDCKHNQCKSTSGNALCELFYGMTDQMGFCHCAERRTDETD